MAKKAREASLHGFQAVGNRDFYLYCLVYWRAPMYECDLAEMVDQLQAAHKIGGETSFFLLEIHALGLLARVNWNMKDLSAARRWASQPWVPVILITLFFFSAPLTITIRIFIKFKRPWSVKNMTLPTRQPGPPWVRTRSNQPGRKARGSAERRHLPLRLSRLNYSNQSCSCGFASPSI